MRKSISAVGVMALGLLPVAGAWAQTGTAWLHVRVEEARKASKVHVNLPMTVVEAVLKASPEMVEEHGKLKLGDHHNLKLADLRKVWKELAAVGDAELVSVESDEENVHVQRKGDIVLVSVDRKAPPAEAGAKAEKAKDAAPAKRVGEVRVEVPVSLVDALLSGTGEEPNLQAAIAELQKRRGDIVRVNDGDSKVRIWIDEQNAPAASAK
jgi:plasmid stabilization system protein ParE